MIESVMREVNNYFEGDVYNGHFIIENNSLVGAVDIKDGQYYRITGSMFNDGVFKHGQEDLIDEEFDGTVYGLYVPRNFLSLVNRINELNSEFGDVMNAPYSSESYANGSYSYTMSQSGPNVDWWRTKFAAELNRWRKV